MGSFDPSRCWQTLESILTQRLALMSDFSDEGDFDGWMARHSFLHCEAVAIWPMGQSSVPI